MKHFGLRAPTQDPPAHLLGVGNLEGQLEAAVGQVAQLLSRMPQALADVGRDALRKRHANGHQGAADDAPRRLQILVGIEVGGLLEALGGHARLADALEGEDAHGLAQPAVREQVEPAVEVGQVIGVDGARRHLVALDRIVADAQRALLEHGALDVGEQLGWRLLQLGAGGADADALAHGVEQAQGVGAEEAADLVQRGGQVGAEHAGARGGQEVAAQQEGQDLGEAELERQAAAELLGDPPDRPVPVAGLVVIYRKAGPGQDVDVAPDGADVAVQGARGVLDRHARGPVDQLQQAPLPVELVAARHSTAIVKVAPVRCQQLDTSRPFSSIRRSGRP